MTWRAAAIAARQANLQQGARTDLVKNFTKSSLADAGKRLGVSRQSVAQARAVLASGDAALVRRLERGDAWG